MKKIAEIILHLQNADQILTIPRLLKRRLNHDTEEFILDEALKFSNSSDITIKVHLAEKIVGKPEELITKAIHEHFAYLKKKSERTLKDTLRMGWINLIIGLAFLIMLVLLVIFIEKQLPKGGFSTTVREIFIILGWVIMWRPVELLLYEWRPFKREAKLFQRLEICRVLVYNQTDI